MPRYSRKRRSGVKRLAGAYIRRRPGPEKKFLDTAISALVFAYDNNGAAPQVSNLIAAGDDSNQRAGRKVRLSSLLLRGSVTAGSTATAPAPARIVVVYDKAPGGATPAVGALFQNGYTGHVDTTSVYNLDNKQRFLFLWDHVFTVEASASVPNSKRYVEKFIPLPGLISRFNATGNTIAQLNEGAVYVYAITDAAAATTQPVLNAMTRIRFTDG